MKINAITYDNLLQVRNHVATGWSAETAFPGTVLEKGDPVSKGQCAITCLWLANQLQVQGYHILFCKGDVHFPDGTPFIENHRWLIVTENQRTLIDLTVDQNGFGEPIVCDSEDNLIKRDIRYVTKWEKTLDQVTDKAGVFDRLAMLSRALSP